MTPDQLSSIDTMKQTSAIGATVVGVASQQIVGANPKRRSLTLTAISGTGIWIGIVNPIAANNGIFLTQSSGPVELSLEKHGSIVTQAWYGIGAAGTDAVGFIDVNDGT